MGQLVEVLAVVIEDAADGPLLGASIDGPRTARRVSARAVEVDGWVLGRHAKPEEVEVVVGGAAIARAPVRRPRPDIAAAFPDREDAASAGFELMLDASRIPAEAEVEVRARLGKVGVPIGSLRLRRCWRDAATGEPPVVAVVVTCEGGEPGLLDRTIRSLDGQRCGPTEVLIVHSTSVTGLDSEALRDRGIRCLSSREEGAAALRHEGLRRSEGQLVAFVEAGRALAPGALARAVEILGRRPEAPALLDGIMADDLAAAVYRRSAFEELGGFRGSSGHSCDGELAQRAAKLDALFEPGILVAGHGS